MKIAFLFPGQGSQKVGMGRDLYEKYELVRSVYREASKITNIDIATLCFNGIKKDYTYKDYIDIKEIGEDLNKTENTQIAIATLSLSILSVLKQKNIRADIAVGLSLGEYLALIYSEMLNFKDGIKLLKHRGYLMQNKLPKGEYSMLAIIGMESSKIEKICNDLNKEGKFIVPANYNYSNQTVVSGNKEVIQEASSIFKENGARKVVELKTSGPFHTKALEQAKNEYINELNKVTFNQGKIKVIKNIDGTFYTEKDNVNEILAKHIINPVRFDKTIKLMEDEGIDTFVEIGPGKTLTGFIKKECKDANVINIYDVETLENALQILENKEGEQYGK